MTNFLVDRDFLNLGLRDLSLFAMGYLIFLSGKNDFLILLSYLCGIVRRTGE
jgi:hypothetical protein